MEPLILTTRLSPPLLRTKAIERKALQKAMKGAPKGGLTWISGPGGSGKTTFVCQWLKNQTCPGVWLNLSEEFNNPNTLLLYLTEGFHRKGLIPKSPWMQPLEARQDRTDYTYYIGSLINDIHGAASEMLLILDDFHRITGGPSGEILKFLLGNIPENLQIILLSQYRPAEQFIDQQSKAKLLEISTEQLYFSREESYQYLRNSLDLKVTQTQVQEVHRLTEGWPGGMQLLAIGGGDKASWKGDFAKVNLYLNKTLRESTKPEEEDFLRRSALLDSFNGDLCDAALALPEGTSEKFIQELKGKNAFIQEWKECRGWYRYHGLFKQMLRKKGLPQEEERALYRRGADWLHQQGRGQQALVYLLRACDFKRAMVLLEELWPEMEQGFQTEQWLTWAEGIPGNWIQGNAPFQLHRAWGFLNAGRLEECAALVDELEGLHGESTEFQLEFLSCKSYLALVKGEWDLSKEYSQKMLTTAQGAGASIAVSQALSYQSIALWKQGILEKAYGGFLGFKEIMLKHSMYSFSQCSYLGLVEIRLEQGRLTEAMRLIEEVFLSKPMENKVAASLYLCKARLLHIRGDFPARDQALYKSRENAKGQCLVDYPSNFHRFQAEIFLDAREYPKALDAIFKAEQLHVRTPSVYSNTLEELRGEILFFMGNYPEAMHWFPQEVTSPPQNFAQESSMIISCQCKKKPLEILKVLKGWETLAMQQKRLLSFIRILLFESLYLSGEDRDRTIRQAMDTAEKEQILGPFLRMGSSMLKWEPLSQSAWGKAIKLGIQGLFTPEDQLSTREIEVLQWIEKGLSNHEIADKLFISLSTVKGHNSRIFEKLQVKRRTEAIARAKELGLL